WALPRGRDLDRNALAADHGRIDAPLGPPVAAGRALEQFAGGGDRFAEGSEGEWVDRALEVEPRGVRIGARRIERGVADLVEPVHRRRQHEAAAGRRRRAPEFPYRHVLSPRSPLLHRNILSFFRHAVNRRDARAFLLPRFCAANVNYDRAAAHTSVSRLLDRA